MKAKTLSLYVKYFLIFIVSVLGIILAAIFLRAACLTSDYLSITTHANSPEYVRITAYTPLYKTSDKSTTLITLPKTYYARLLSSPNETTDIIKVKYGQITGFMDASAAEYVTSLPTGAIETWSPQGITESPHGTYLRTSPNTTNSSNISSLIEASSSVTILGFIEGDRPTDGTTNTWYLVDYESGPTTVTRGYIYAERIILENQFTEQNPLLASPSTETTNENSPITDTSVNGSTNIEGNINFSSGMKWFIIVLFSVIALIIFSLILVPTSKKTSKALQKSAYSRNATYSNELDPQPQASNKNSSSCKQNNTKNRQKQPKNNTKNCKITPISPRKLPEFASMLDFTDNPQTSPLSENHSSSPSHQKTHSLPPSLSKYFTAKEDDLL